MIDLSDQRQQYVELFGETPTYLAMGIAAALRYDYLEDPEAKLIQETIQQQGICHAIETFTGLKTGTALFTAVEKEYRKLKEN